MQDFIPGQRWLSDADVQLGLGTVLEVAARTVTLAYLASGETRTYARHNAPLTRVSFAVGDRLRLQSGECVQVSAVEDIDGLLVYRGRNDNGDDLRVAETELDHFLQLNRPAERLFNGQIDKDNAFELRYATLQHINRLHHSALYGLTGVRTQLIPHQLYIAHEVARRYAPRVLLADEVGLGKTIEAGLILHHQLLTERAQRALILVPESLLHQWLVEMLRRFNLYFSVFDEDRCLAIEEYDEQQNPFLTEQQILCSIEFISTHTGRLQQCLAAEWDLLVVDEAHHLQWSPQQASEEYLAVEQLAANTRGLLLLTATPEQLGKQSHFARLRLLDPDRFVDYEQFVADEQNYRPLARAVEQLLNAETLDADATETVQRCIQESNNPILVQTLDELGDNRDLRLQLVNHLLDRHGTGRVLFRNTRHAVQGFPGRRLRRYALPLPAHYLNALQQDDGYDTQQARRRLCPEQLVDQSDATWIEQDPRVAQLIKILEAHAPNKVLVIAAHAQTAVDIAQYLKTRSRINAGVFHEHMNIVERDRAAAYFAEPIQGAQVLICSEIGSEGRNFQFAHHLVLFDLPLNPDLLEQRIGRLDRIGQQFDIQIHVPYFEHSPQALMLDWYHQALNAFEHTCPAGHSVFVEVEATLLDALCNPQHGEHRWPALIEHSRQRYEQLNQALQQGRDPLLEYNSCRPHLAEALTAHATQQDRHNDLPDYMDLALDVLGVEYDIYRGNSFILRAGDHMTASLSGIDDEGLAVTYDRQTALSNEDLQYLTWEHPLLVQIMDHVLAQQQGNSALTALSYAHARPGSLLVEAVFVLEAAHHTRLQSDRYLPPTPLRVVIDEKGGEHSRRLPHAFIRQAQTLVDKGTAVQVVAAKKDVIHDMIKQAEQRAQQQTPELLTQAHQHSERILRTEIERLQALANINPHVREDEIDYFRQQLQALSQLIDGARLRLDALRVMVVTD